MKGRAGPTHSRAPRRVAVGRFRKPLQKLLPTPAAIVSDAQVTGTAEGDMTANADLHSALFATHELGIALCGETRAIPHRREKRMAWVLANCIAPVNESRLRTRNHKAA